MTGDRIDRGPLDPPGDKMPGGLHDVGHPTPHATRERPGIPYERTEQQLANFGLAADRLVRDIAPATTLDIGCAQGLLVEALRDRGIDAKGFDVSDSNISQAREDVRPHLWVGRALDPIPGRYDLVTGVDVLADIDDGGAQAAIANICAVTDDVVFASTPDEYPQGTHVNGRALDYWSELFARHGLVRDLSFDGSFFAWWAARYRRRRDPWARVIGEYERENSRLRVDAHDPQASVAEPTQERARPNPAAVRGIVPTQVEGWTLVDEMGLTLARAAADAVERSIAGVEVDLGRRIDLAAAELQSRSKGNPIGLRQFVRLHTPLWLRRLVVRGVTIAWWSVTLQLPRRLKERRGQRTAQRAAEVAGATELLRRRFRLADAVPTYAAVDPRRSVSIVADSLGAARLRGGAGTALIIGATVAARMDARLRLITRVRRPEAARVAEMLESNGLDVPRDLEVVFAPPGSSEGIPLTAGDAFLTTGWRETRAILAGVRPDRVIQVLDDDERQRYGAGDDRLRCAETLSDPTLRLLVSGKSLFEALSGRTESLPAFAERAIWFEPAFPVSLFHHERTTTRHAATRNFLLSAEGPGAARLYWRALEALTRAMEEGILDHREWNFTVIGTGIHRVRLPWGIVPEIIDDLTSAEYAQVARGTDLALVLSGESRPGLAALRLVASGAVVVFDGGPPDGTADGSTGNLIPSALAVDALCRSLASGVAFARDETARAASCARLALARDWRTTLEPVTARCVEWLVS